jgi:hypothetical protein
MLLKQLVCHIRRYTGWIRLASVKVDNMAVEAVFELIKHFLYYCRPEPPNKLSERKQSKGKSTIYQSQDLLLHRVQRIIELTARIPKNNHIVSPLESEAQPSTLNSCVVNTLEELMRCENFNRQVRCKCLFKILSWL